MNNKATNKLKNANGISGKKGSSGFSGKLAFILLSVGIVVLFIVLICVEAFMGNKITIRNKSSHKIASLKIWYEDDIGTITDDILEFSEIESKAKIVESIKSLGLSELRGQAWLTVRIRFEDGGEAELQSGQILNDFKGRLSLEVSDTSGEEILLRMKAGEGIFNSSSATDCDDAYYINPQNGYVE